WLTVTLRPGESDRRAARELDDAAAILARAAAGVEPRQDGGAPPALSSADAADFVALVRAAQDEMVAGHLTKVVLARCAWANAGRAFDAREVLEALPG